jgi:transposase InsO family protein
VKGVGIGAVSAENAQEFRGADRQPCALCPDLADIERRRTKPRRPQTNGVAERFDRTVPDELFRVKMRGITHETVGALQADLDARLAHDTTGPPHPGYPDRGRRPLETIMKLASPEGRAYTVRWHACRPADALPSSERGR